MVRIRGSRQKSPPPNTSFWGNTRWCVEPPLIWDFVPLTPIPNYYGFGIITILNTSLLGEYETLVETVLNTTLQRSTGLSYKPPSIRVYEGIRDFDRNHPQYNSVKGIRDCTRFSYKQHPVQVYEPIRHFLKVSYKLPPIQVYEGKYKVAYTPNTRWCVGFRTNHPHTKFLYSLVNSYWGYTPPRIIE